MRDKGQGTRDKGLGKKLGIVLVFVLVLNLSLVPCLLSLVPDEEVLSPKELIVRAWEAWGAKDYESAFYYTDKCIELYSEDAKLEQASLTGFPATEA
ncbi:MAG: hypothetical protein KKD11_04230, partial [Candidatus Omnitrophica bacterium]|nr:hypothetical protein [Candidatus Omnitrophota bacterium]